MDLSAVNRFSGSGKKSPAEWARTGRYRQLHKLLVEQYGMDDADIWEVEGERKGARTWVEPTVARAYIEDLEIGKCSCNEIAEKIENLESRIKELESIIFEEKEQP